MNRAYLAQDLCSSNSLLPYMKHSVSSSNKNTHATLALQVINKLNQKTYCMITQ